MKRFALIALPALTLGMGLALGISLIPTLAMAEEAKPKTCRMEQQCKWVNFKKVCTYVKVCR